jgi:cytochrome c556
MADLEAPDPAPEPTPEPEPVAVAPADPMEAEPEGTTEVEGAKHVPLGHLINERREKAALKQKADQFDQLAGYVNQVKPYIEFLQANPNLISQTRQEPTPVTPTQPVDEESAELARTLDLYTSDGQPDVKRAQKLIDRVDKIAGTRAQAEVKPLQDSTQRERAQYSYQRALVTKTPDGRAPDRAILDELWRRTPDHIKATEEGASGIWALALGFSEGQGRTPVPPQASPVLHTEPPGGRTPNRAPLSALEEKIAKIRGLSEKDYHERTKGYTPGRVNVLED